MPVGGLGVPETVEDGVAGDGAVPAGAPEFPGVAVGAGEVVPGEVVSGEVPPDPPPFAFEN